jgi:hypothetical protein
MEIGFRIPLQRAAVRPAGRTMMVLAQAKIPSDLPNAQ